MLIILSSLYWFESTACPLLAGTFGPIASAFNVCALSVSWREYQPPGKVQSNGDNLQDPKWSVSMLECYAQVMS